MFPPTSSPGTLDPAPRAPASHASSSDVPTVSSSITPDPPIPAPAPRELDAPEPDPRQLTCLRCRYDLRGLADDKARCPECGLPAYWSLRAPEQLAHYPAGWVAAMARAVRLLLTVYAGMFLFMLAMTQDFWPASQFVTFCALAVAAAVQALATWMLARSSGHWTEPRAPINRWTLRIAPLGILSATACAAWLTKDYSRAVERAAIAGMIVGAAAPTAIFLRLRAVARMIADPGLAEHSAIVGWGFVATAMLIAAIAIADEWMNVKMQGPLGLLIALTMMVSLMLFLLWGAFIFLSCVIAFSRAAKVATAAWKADAPPV